MNALNTRQRAHDWRTADITSAIAEEAQERASEPEGHSFLVLTDDDAVAREVAPLMAQRLYPDRSFGEVIHSEPVTYDGPAIEVVLRVR